MSLVSHWRARKDKFGRGKPTRSLWGMIILLLFVLYIIHLLGR